MARRTDMPMMNLIAGITDLDSCLEAFAQGHKKVIAIGAAIFGEVRGVFVLAGDDLYSPVGPDRMRMWARIIGNMPAGLLQAFEAELAIVKASRRERD